MRKIVITGAAGFVGSQLAKPLPDRGEEAVLDDNLCFGHLDNLVIDGRTLGSCHCVDVRDSGLANLCESADSMVHMAGISALTVCQVDPHEGVASAPVCGDPSMFWDKFSDRFDGRFPPSSDGNIEDRKKTTVGSPDKTADSFARKPEPDICADLKPVWTDAVRHFHSTPAA